MYAIGSTITYIQHTADRKGEKKGIKKVPIELIFSHLPAIVTAPELSLYPPLSAWLAVSKNSGLTAR
jgi:hypothetical protein